jgi:hypothetical protein
VRHPDFDPCSTREHHPPTKANETTSTSMAKQGMAHFARKHSCTHLATRDSDVVRSVCQRRSSKAFWTTSSGSTCVRRGRVAKLRTFCFRKTDFQGCGACAANTYKMTRVSRPALRVICTRVSTSHLLVLHGQPTDRDDVTFTDVQNLKPCGSIFGNGSVPVLPQPLKKTKTFAPFALTTAA